MLELFQVNIIHIIKIALTLILSAIIGWEREQNKKTVGVRDLILVTLGATIFSILALELVNLASTFSQPVRYDFGRIIAYTIIGIGFLGSGIIVQNKNKVEGVTTAGTLWAMVSVGLLIGIGQLGLAILTAGCIYFILKLKYIRVKFTGGGRYEKKRRNLRKTF